MLPQDGAVTLNFGFGLEKVAGHAVDEKLGTREPRSGPPAGGTSGSSAKNGANWRPELWIKLHFRCPS